MGQTHVWHAWPVTMLIRLIRLRVHRAVIVFTLHRVIFHGLQLRNARGARCATQLLILHMKIISTQLTMVPAVALTRLKTASLVLLILLYLSIRPQTTGMLVKKVVSVMLTCDASFSGTKRSLGNFGPRQVSIYAHYYRN